MRVAKRTDKAVLSVHPVTHGDPGEICRYVKNEYKM